MSDVVIAALIGAGASIIVELIASWRRGKKRAIEEAVKEAKLEARLTSIEHKLDIHNGYAEKLGGIQTDIAVIKAKIDMLSKEIEHA